MARDCNRIYPTFGGTPDTVQELLYKKLCDHNGGNKGYPDPFLHKDYSCIFNGTQMFYLINLIIDVLGSLEQSITIRYSQLTY